MIAATSVSSQLKPASRSVPWQRQLAEAVTEPRELCAMLQLDPAAMGLQIDAALDFPLRVPRSFVARMRPGDPRDPLLLQVLPRAEELTVAPGFLFDPVGDLDAQAGTGLLHKYEGRALLVATGACAVHCRYCFRRHFPYAEQSALLHGWQDAVAAIRADRSITEVILSGGDPLSLSERRLQQLSDALIGIPQVRRLRIHTRYPVVLPDRVDENLLNWLRSLPIQKVIVIHANHAQEIDADVQRACRDLAASGATLLNQSVLLAGINDSLAALAELSESLFAAGVLPYYLHVLDKVQGAAHFDLAERRALELHEQLRWRLPGYLVPRLVREVSGAPAKMPVGEADSGYNPPASTDVSNHRAEY